MGMFDDIRSTFGTSKYGNLGDKTSSGEGQISAIDVKTKNGQVLTKRYLDVKEAYVSGFFFATIEDVPSGFISYLNSNYPSGAWSREKVEEVFTSSVYEVQLPSDTIKTIQFSARSGRNRNVPLYAQKNNTITIQFLADQNMEITSLLSAWFDYVDGVGNGTIDAYDNNLIGEEILDGVLKSRTAIYGVNFYYAALMPDMRTINFAFAGEGLYPTTSPINDLGHSMNNHDSVKHSITFSVDYYDYWIKGKSTNSWIFDLLDSKIRLLSGSDGVLSLNDIEKLNSIKDNDKMELHLKDDYKPDGSDKFLPEAYQTDVKERQDNVKYNNTSSEFNLAYEDHEPDGGDKFSEFSNKKDYELKL